MHQSIKRTIVFMLIFLIFFSISVNNAKSAPSPSSFYYNEAKAIAEKSIVMYIGKPFAFKENVKVSIDSRNVATSPFIKDGRTMVPVRFITESLDAQVEWISETSTVKIFSNDIVITMIKDQLEMNVNGNKVALDKPVTIINGRTYIPLRAVSEALDNQVFYEKRLIVISKSSNAVITNPYYSQKNPIEELRNWFLDFEYSEKKFFLDMHPSKAVFHVSEPIVYIVDKYTKKMTKFNYITAQAKTINLNEVPQAMAYSNNELYLLYKDKLSIIDANSLKVKKSFDGVLKSFDKGVREAYDITIAKNGTFFISYTDNIIMSYKINNGSLIRLAVSGIFDYQGESFDIEVNSDHSRIYYASINDVKKLSYATYMNKNFVKKSAKSHSIDYTKVIKISPDGKYVFSGSGSVYDKDLNRITGFYSHYPGYSDFAVDMTNNYVFAGQVNKSVLVYNYSTFAKLGEVDLIGTITAISVYKDELIAICWDMHKTRVYRISY